MPAKFHVKQTFAIEKRHVFVLVGAVVEGSITAGMHAAIPLNSSLSITLPVHGVELVRRGGAESVALTSGYSGPEELDILRGLNLGGETLAVFDPETGEEDAAPATPPIACTLSPAELRERRDSELRPLRTRAVEVSEIATGYALRFPADDDLLAELVRVIELERRCCAFLRFALVVSPANGPVWLELTGPEGVKELLREMLELAPEALTPGPSPVSLPPSPGEGRTSG